MYDCEATLISLLQAGIRGFLKKNIPALELRRAINHVMKTGYYFPSHTIAKMANLFLSSEEGDMQVLKSKLTENEFWFLKLSTFDLTYKEIAEIMKIRARSIDTIREQLFIKLNVKSRIGLARIAFRNGLGH
jgi:DNA-binding NarL/FixJ family response regulator